MKILCCDSTTVQLDCDSTIKDIYPLVDLTEKRSITVLPHNMQCYKTSHIDGAVSNYIILLNGYTIELVNGYTLLYKLLNSKYLMLLPGTLSL